MTIERASDNPFPSVLLVEGDPEALAANPASGQRRLAVGTDHLLYLVDDAGVKHAIGGVSDHGGLTGLSDDDHPQYQLGSTLTTRGDLYYRGAATVGRLALGTSGKVLTSDGTDASWQTPGAAALSYQQNQLGADVNLSTANTYFDGPAVTLSAGTWLLLGSVLFDGGGGSSTQVTAKLWDGTTVAASSEVITYAGGAYDNNHIALGAVVVIAAGTPTWKISAAGNAGTGSKIKAAASDNGAGNNASTLTAIKIA